MADDNPEIVIGGRDDSGPAWQSAQAHADEFARQMHEVAGDVIGDVAKIAAEFVTLQKAVEAAVEGINKADEIRDLRLSLETFTGSANKAGEAMRFFAEQSARTRSTAEELGKVFRDLMPLGSSRGFGQDAMQQITVMLSQLATVSGQSLEAIESGFRRALAGGNMGAGRNPIMAALGFTKENVDVSWKEFIDRLYSKTQDFDKFGESFASSTHKVKEAWLDAFGEGFNNAMDDGRKAYTSLLDAFTNPALILAIHNIGDAVGELALRLANAATWWNTGLLNNSKQTPGMQSMGDFLDWLNNPRPDVWGELTDTTQDKRRQHGGSVGIVPRPGGYRMGIGGADDVAAASAEQFGPYLDASERSRINFEAGMEALRKQADHAGKVAIGMKKAADASKDIKDLLDNVAPDYAALTGPGDARNPKSFFNAPQSAADYERELNAQLDAAKAAGEAVGALIWDLGASKRAADAFAAEANQKMKDEFAGELGGVMTALFHGGGKSFVEALANEFPKLMGDAAKQFSDVLFGKQAVTGIDPATGKTVTLSEATTGLFGAGAAKYGKNALALASVGAAGYEAGVSGQQNSVTMSAIGGAATGMSMGPWGALAGAMIGIAGALYGKEQKRDEYKYAIPSIDASGNVTLDRPDHQYGHWFRKHWVPNNISDPEAQQMTGQITDTYDTFRNSYARTLMTLGVSNINPLGAIDGKFQDNPSAHFMENFQMWLSQTLPRTIAGEFKEQLKSGFGSVGLSGSQFDSMWAKFNGLDPAKAAQMMSDIATALKGIQGSSTYFGTSASARMSDLTATGNRTFADSLAVSDQDIVTFASHLKDLVGQDQITAAGQLADMEKQRQDAEKQFLQTLIDTMKAADQAAKALNQSLDVRLIHKKDGSPDYEGLANYYRNDANSAITAFTGATNPQDAQAAWNRFLGDLDKVSQAGYGINTQTGDAWTRWAQQQITNEQPLFDAAIQKMGDAVANQDARFLQQITPSVDAFKNSIGGANVTVGDFGTAVDTSTAKLGTFNRALDGATDRLHRIGSDSSANSFADRTAASRSR